MNVEDRLELHQVVALYSHLVDERDFAGFDGVFTENCVFDMSAYGLPRYDSRRALQEGFATLQHPRSHHTTNVVILDEGDGRATIKSKILVVFERGRVGFGVYLDDAVRTSAGWRIRSRVVRREP